MVPNPELRWLVPEIVREAIYLGMREAPFYPNIIASDHSRLPESTNGWI